MIVTICPYGSNYFPVFNYYLQYQAPPPSSLLPADSSARINPTSAKFFTHMLTPTPSSALAGWDVSNPDRGYPRGDCGGGTRGAVLKRDASCPRHPRPRDACPRGTGPGHGLALAHSVPITTCSKYVLQPERP